MIAFYDGKTEKLIGTVKLSNGSLVADVNSLKEYESYDPKEFFAQFSNWGNGYVFSMELPDDQTPPEQAEVEHFSETWTAEQIQEAYKKFKETGGEIENA